MTRIISAGTRVFFGMLLVAAASTHAWAQGSTWDKRTFLTFSGTVQVPGATLPAGTYVFRLANPDTKTVWHVLDARERHVLATFFSVRTADRTWEEQNAADGKPVVTFHETRRGVPPAVHVLYYPTDPAGSEFLYSKKQAETFAVLTQPSIPTIAGAASTDAAAPVTAPQPEAIQARNDASPETVPQTDASQTPISDSPPVATSGSDDERPVGTSGRDQAAAPSPVAAESRATELPATASALPLIGIAGVLALGAVLSMRRSRSRGLVTVQGS
jgi:hypothetical protein